MDGISKVGLSIPNAGYMLPWYKVRDALLEQVRARPESITIHLQCRMVSVQDTDEFVTVHYLNGSGKSCSVQGCLLIGCDGVNSFVRQQAPDLPPARSSGATTWRGSLTVPEHSALVSLLDKGITPLNFLNWGPTNFAVFNFHAKVPNRMAWSANTKDSVETNSQPWDNFKKYIPNEDENKAVLKEVFALSNPEDLSYTLDLKVVDPETWISRGRVTVIGDAAHAIRPASGLGESLAFEDCVLLCRQLSACDKDSLNGKVNVEALLDRFIQSRQSRVSKIWKDEWDRSESSYTGNPMPPPTKEWQDWIHAGV